MVFGRPVTMKARLDINVTTIEMTVEQLVPDIHRRLAKPRPSQVVYGSQTFDVEMK